MHSDAIINHILGLGAARCCFFSAHLLVPQARIRAYCRENKCGCYGKNLMCPPHVGRLVEIADRFKQFNNGLLIQYSRRLNVHSDREGLKQSKLRLHRIILDTEQNLLERQGVFETLATIGGSCEFCDACASGTQAACRFPEHARPSLEALGVDVMALLRRLGFDNRFHADRITWTGAILFKTKKETNVA